MFLVPLLYPGSMYPCFFIVVALRMCFDSLPPCLCCQEAEQQQPQQPQELANFDLSGKLAKDQTTGNVYKGVVLKVAAYFYHLSPHVVIN